MNGARPTPPPGISSRWTNSGAWRIHSLATQAEPAKTKEIVFVHGIGVASAYFIPTMRALAATHRCHALDLPGFGASTKPPFTLDVAGLADALADWLEAAQLDRALVAGNSFGCQVVAEFAVRRSARASCVALLGPTMDPAARTAARQVARWLRNNVHERPSQLPILLRDYRAAGLRRPYETFRFALRHEIERRLPQIALPALVVRGGRDPIVPQRWAEEAARLLPRGRLVVIPGAGHTVNYNSPEQSARVLARFLDDEG